MEDQTSTTNAAGQDVLEAAFPPLSAPTGRLTRRGALSRLLGLGAGAAAAVAVTGPVQAAPDLPAWLAADPWLAPYVERFVAAVLSVPDPLAWAEVATDWAELMCLGHAKNFGQDRRPSLPEREPPRLTRVPDRRIVSVCFPKLTKNDRRRVRRWIARQPVGPHHPLLRLRSGWGTIDALDVASPTPRYLDGSPRNLGWRAVEDLRASLRRTQRSGPPPLGAFEVLCSHDWPDRAHSMTMMHVDADGRLAPDHPISRWV